MAPFGPLLLPAQRSCHEHCTAAVTPVPPTLTNGGLAEVPLGDFVGQIGAHEDGHFDA